MGHVVMGYLTTFKHVETGMYFRIWFADIDFEKKICRCQMVQPLFLRIQPIVFFRFSCRCRIPESLGKSRRENVLTVDQKERTTFERV